MLTPYKKLLTMTQDAIKEVLAVKRAAEQKSRAQLELSQIDTKITEKEAEIEKLASEYPIKFDKLIDALDDKALLERRQEQFRRLVAELFPE